MQRVETACVELIFKSRKTWAKRLRVLGSGIDGFAVVAIQFVIVAGRCFLNVTSRLDGKC